MKRILIISASVCIALTFAACGAGENTESYIDPVFGEIDLPLTQAQCKTREVGGPKSCADAGYWKKLAHKTCTKAGLTVSKGALGSSCGKGQYQSVKFTCCANAETPEKPTVIPGKPIKPQSKCIARKLGEPNNKKSCRPAGYWKKLASKQCSAKGGKTTKFALGQSCGKGNYTTAKFLCCKIAEKPSTPVKPVKPVLENENNNSEENSTNVTPQPELKCKVAELGDAQDKGSCAPVSYYKGTAIETCANAGGKVTAMKFGTKCKKGGFLNAKYICCKKALVITDSNEDNSDENITEEPVEPQMKCFADSVGEYNNKKSCKPAAFYKGFAYKTCIKAGGQITKFSLGQKCGEGMHTQAKFQCCKKAQMNKPTTKPGVKPAPSKTDKEVDAKPTKKKPTTSSKDVKPAPSKKG